MKERGVSPLIGLIFLIGMVAVVSAGLLVVGSEMMGDTQHQVEEAQIKQSFVEFSETISSVRVNSDTPKLTTLNAGEQGAIAHRDSATYKIWAKSYDGNITANIENGSIGTIEYSGDDGTKVAFEGGGVFSETGEETQVLSAPPISYDRETETLSFTVTELRDSLTLESGDVKISQTNSTSGGQEVIEDYHIFIEVNSEYCQGWEQYFEEQAGDIAIQKECYGGENSEGAVEVRLGYMDIQNAFETGLVVPDQDNYSGPSGNSGKENVEMKEGEYEPINSIVESLHDDLNSSPPLTSRRTNTAGNYSVEKMDGSYEFSLTDGDAIVAVNGSVSPEKIDVTKCGNGDHSLKVYAKGDFDLSNDIEPTCDGGSISTIQFYGMNTSTVQFQDSSSTFRGLVYVASDGAEFDPESNDYQVEIDGSGNADINGAIIAHSVNVGSASNSLDLVGVENPQVDVVPEGYEPAPQLVYLNIAKHELDVKNS